MCIYNNLDGNRRADVQPIVEVLGEDVAHGGEDVVEGAVDFHWGAFRFRAQVMVVRIG